MMNFAKTAVLSSALAGALVLAAPAFAQKTEPNGTYRGHVTVSHGLVADCTAELQVNSSNRTGAVTYFGQPHSFLCSRIRFEDQPYSYTFDPVSGTGVVSGVRVVTLTGQGCAGEITGSWVWGYDEIWVDTSLPALTAGPPCNITGILEFQP